MCIRDRLSITFKTLPTSADWDQRRRAWTVSKQKTCAWKAGRRTVTEVVWWWHFSGDVKPSVVWARHLDSRICDNTATHPRCKLVWRCIDCHILWNKKKEIKINNFSSKIESCRVYTAHFPALIYPPNTITTTHKRLKERLLIGRNRTKRAHFRGKPLFQATYNSTTENS